METIDVTFARPIDHLEGVSLTQSAEGSLLSLYHTGSDEPELLPFFHKAEGEKQFTEFCFLAQTLGVGFVLEAAP